MLWNISSAKTPERAVCLNPAQKYFDFAATAGTQRYFASTKAPRLVRKQRTKLIFGLRNTNFSLDFKLDHLATKKATLSSRTYALGLCTDQASLTYLTDKPNSPTGMLSRSWLLFATAKPTLAGIQQPSIALSWGKTGT